LLGKDVVLETALAFLPGDTTFDQYYKKLKQPKGIIHRANAWVKSQSLFKNPFWRSTKTVPVVTERENNALDSASTTNDTVLRITSVKSVSES
jgi:hypothetical protein